MNWQTLDLLFIAAVPIAVAIVWALLRTQRSYRRVLRDLLILRSSIAVGDQNSKFLSKVQFESSVIRGLACSLQAAFDQYEQRLDEQKAADEARRELVSNISHDLRSPLTAIHGFIETSRIQIENGSSGKVSEYLDIALKNSKSLIRLVDDMFQLSKLEAYVLVPRIQLFSLAELIDAVCSRYRPLCEKKNLRLDLTIEDSSCCAYGDEGLIERVLVNLIDNAIRHTPAGGSIQMEALSDEAYVTVSVRDTGVGIPKSDLPYVCERFYRVGKDRSRSSGGSGLGLAIAKRIMDAHDARFTIESEIGKGTSVKFTLSSEFKQSQARQ